MDPSVPEESDEWTIVHAHDHSDIAATRDAAYWKGLRRPHHPNSLDSADQLAYVRHVLSKQVAFAKLHQQGALTVLSSPEIQGREILLEDYIPVSEELQGVNFTVKMEIGTRDQDPLLIKAHVSWNNDTHTNFKDIKRSFVGFRLWGQNSQVTKMNATLGMFDWSYTEEKRFVYRGADVGGVYNPRTGASISLTRICEAEEMLRDSVTPAEGCDTDCIPVARDQVLGFWRKKTTPVKHLKYSDEKSVLFSQPTATQKVIVTSATLKEYLTLPYAFSKVFQSSSFAPCIGTDSGERMLSLGALEGAIPSILINTDFAFRTSSARTPQGGEYSCDLFWNRKEEIVRLKMSESEMREAFSLEDVPAGNENTPCPIADRHYAGSFKATVSWPKVSMTLTSRLGSFTETKDFSKEEVKGTGLCGLRQSSVDEALIFSKAMEFTDFSARVETRSCV